MAKKGAVLDVLQRIGKSFMLPIAVLPAAGILLGLGSSFTNEVTLASIGLAEVCGQGTAAFALFTIMSKVGSAIFDNLPLIFAVGIALGMAKKEKAVAALSAVIAFLVMHVSINAMLVIDLKILADGTLSPDVLEGSVASVCGIKSLQMGVFGGIIVGLGVAALHNKFYKIEFPEVFSFFGGTRFVPIISTFVFMIVGVLCYFVWPPIQNGIYSLGGLVTETGYVGTLIFGLIKRALIPFGLHHVFYMPFWQTAVGGTMVVNGVLVSGGQNIFFAQLADAANIEHFSSDATRYFSGEFIFMIFGLPGAALAMYHCAKKDKKKDAGGLLLSASLTSMLTGITEPIEFSFLFAAPLLFGVQVVLAGLAYMFAHMLNIAVGLTFSGGFLDLFFFGILQGNAKTSWLLIIPMGILYFFLYYIIFRVLITKLNLKTPGREDDDEAVQLHSKADAVEKYAANKKDKANALSALILRGLGGKDNVASIDCCATRLRVSVKDADLVDEVKLKKTGAHGVVCKGAAVQVIFGPKVSIIKTELEDYIERLNADDADDASAGEVRAADGTVDAVDVVGANDVAAGIKADVGSAPSVLASNTARKRVRHGDRVLLFAAEPADQAEFSYTITEENGIHARPAGELAALLKGFDCDVVMRANGRKASATSLIEIMGLGATKGTEIVVTAQGSNAAQAIKAARAFCEEKL